MLLLLLKILTETVDSANWDIKKMREEPHDWVGRLATNCSNIWAFLDSNGDEGFLADASSAVREQVWLEVCQVLRLSRKYFIL